MSFVTGYYNGRSDFKIKLPFADYCSPKEWYVGTTSSTYKARVEIQTSIEGIEIKVEQKILDFICKNRVQHFIVNGVVIAYLIWSEKEVKGSPNVIIKE